MNHLINFAYLIYNYCTDFVINVANILQLSYYEINFILFVVLYPALLVSGLLMVIIQHWRLNRLRRKKLPN